MQHNKLSKKIKESDIGKSLGGAIGEAFLHQTFDSLLADSQRIFQNRAKIFDSSAQVQFREELLLKVSSLSLNVRAFANEFAHGVPNFQEQVIEEASTMGDVLRGTWKERDCSVKIVRNADPTTLEKLFISLYNDRTAFQKEFDITQRMNPDGSRVIYIITNPGSMPTSARFVDKMEDMKLESFVHCSTDVRSLFPKDEITYQQAVEGVKRGCVTSDPEFAKWDEFCKEVEVIAKEAFGVVINDRIVQQYPEKLLDPRNRLTVHEAVAFRLYTTNNPKIYPILNRRLRDPSRKDATLTPWVPFLALLDRGCSKLKPMTQHLHSSVD